MFKSVDVRRTADQAYTIGSPCEPSAQVSQEFNAVTNKTDRS